MCAPAVTKEYREDWVPDDPERGGDWAYRYWQYIFDFGGSRYRARVYVDEPEVAYLMELGRPAAAPRKEEVVRVVATHLGGDGVREIQMLGPSGAFEPVSAL